MILIVIYLCPDNSKVFFINIHACIHTYTYTYTYTYTFIIIYWAYFMHKVLQLVLVRQWQSKQTWSQVFSSFQSSTWKDLNKIIPQQNANSSLWSAMEIYSMVKAYSRGMWFSWEGWTNLFHLGARVLWHRNEVESQRCRNEVETQRVGSN